MHASSAEAVFAPAEEPRPLGALLAASATEDRTDAPDSECATTLDVSETVGATSGECVQEPVFVDAEEGRETVETDAPRRGRAFWLRLCAICCAGIVLLAALVYYNFFSSGWGGVVLKEGERCTPFTLELYQTANENTVFSIEASKGKVTVINFWETTCDPCVEELPYFEKVNREYNGEIVMVAVHSTHVTEPVQKFIDKEDREKNKESWSEYTMMMAVDREDVNAYEMLGGKGAYPITVILDQEGVITCIRQGKMPETELRAEIIKAMG
ncbi:MAG: TlpA family protein disulfide reductase [Candidatus Gallimonas sp.]